jgi:hypothetical protein
MKNRKHAKRKAAFWGLLLIGIMIFCPVLFAQRRGGMRMPPDMQGPPPAGPRQPPQPPAQPGNPVQASVQQENASITLKFHVEEYGITMDLVNCPLQKALEDLAARTGVIFEVRTQDNYPVSLHIKTPIDLVAAVKRIASLSNTVFIYNDDSESPQKIKMVKIFPATASLPQPSVIYLGTGVVTKSNDDIENAEQAIKILTEGKDIALRQKAIAFLVSEKNEKAIESLVPCLSDQSPEIRVAVVEGLAALNARNTLPEIIKTLKDANAGVRQSAVVAIALIGDYSNIKDLRSMRSDKDVNVLAAVENAIRKLSEPKSK